MKKLISIILLFSLLTLCIIPVSAGTLSDNADVNIKVGEEYTLEAVIKYLKDNNISTEIPIKWETSDPKLATVSKGVVKGIKQGIVYIKASATDKGKTYQTEAKVNVISTVTGVRLNKYNLNLKVGESQQLIEEVIPSTAFLKKVNWKSDDTKIATVSNGLVKGISAGKINITVSTVDGFKFEECEVIVESSVNRVSLKDHSLSKKVGEEWTMFYEVLPETAFEKSVKWTSGDSKILSVSNGKAKALSSGTASIKVETVDGHYKDECVVKVQGMVTGITLNKTELTLKQGDKEEVNAKITPSDALEQGITWKSEYSKIASVSNGTIKGDEIGQTHIIATSKDGGYTAKVKVNVIQADNVIVDRTLNVSSIVLLDSNITMNVGENRWYKFTYSPDDAETPKVKASCKGLDGKTSLSTQIKNDGINVEASKVGDYTLIISVESNPTVNDECTIHVKSLAYGIEISKTSLELFVGESEKLKGTALPKTIVLKDVTWKSSEPKIAKVNSSTGEVTGVAEGDCNIIATTIDGGYQAICAVKVKDSKVIGGIKIKDEDGNIIGEKPKVEQSNDNRPITITIDGKPIEMDQPPIMEGERVLAPLRAVFESLGATVYWNEELQSAIGILDDKTIQLTIDDINAKVNGEPIALEVPAKVLNNRTLVPVRFIAETLGVIVNWDEKTQTVVIITKK